MLGEARAEEVVGEHGRERRRDGDGEADADAVGREAVEHVEERQVRLPERLVEPALFEGPRVLGVAHPGQVRVEDERDVAEHGGPLADGAGARRRGRGRAPRPRPRWPGRPRGARRGGRWSRRDRRACRGGGSRRPRARRGRRRGAGSSRRRRPSPRARRRRRSTSRGRRGGRAAARVSSSPSRHSMPSAPWPMAGSETSGERISRRPVGPAQPLEPGEREHDGVEHALLHLAQARVDVAAHRLGAEIGPGLEDGDRAPQARRARRARPAGSSASFCPVRVTRASRGSSRGGDAGEREAGGELGGDVLDRVDGEVRAPVEERLLQLLDEEALAADVLERPVLRLVPRGDDLELVDDEAGHRALQRAGEGARLREGERGSAGGEDEAHLAAMFTLPGAPRARGSTGRLTRRSHPGRRGPEALPEGPAQAPTTNPLAWSGPFLRYSARPGIALGLPYAPPRAVRRSLEGT